MIVLIAGESGVGKSTIVKGLKDMYPDLYNIILSYTTRRKRNQYDNDHIFIKNVEELEGKEIVASTEIDGNFYGATSDQFLNNFINLYIVDAKGITDVEEFYDGNELLKIKITRKDIDIDEERSSRDIDVDYGNYDYIIDNDGTIEEVLEIVQKTIENEVRCR